MTHSLLEQSMVVAQRMGRFMVLVAFAGTNIAPTQGLEFVNKIELAHRHVPPTESRKTGSVAGMSVAENGVVTVLSTAYSSTPDQTDGDPFTTASGVRPSQRTIAANFLPLGTKVRIGKRVYIVEDRLNARYNNVYIVDLWMPNRAAAKLYGVREVEMEVLKLP